MQVNGQRVRTLCNRILGGDPGKMRPFCSGHGTVQCKLRGGISIGLQDLAQLYKRPIASLNPYRTSSKISICSSSPPPLQSASIPRGQCLQLQKRIAGAGLERTCDILSESFELAFDVKRQQMTPQPEPPDPLSSSPVSTQQILTKSFF
jgi:hypothetical protein